MKRPLPIGISDFKKVIEGGYAYADKTLLVQELMEKDEKALLFTRPCHFGKTLNLSMLRYFFEKTPEDNGHLFKNLNIWKLEKYQAMQGKFPVIFLTFKGMLYDSWERAFQGFQHQIGKEFERHRYLLMGNFLSPFEQQKYLEILCRKSNQSTLEESLSLLTQWLCRYHGSQVMVFVDACDTPLYGAHVAKYYDVLSGFMRNLLSEALTDNSNLKKGMLAGILGLGKEIGINAFTVLDHQFQDKFGFLDFEIQQLLEEKELTDRWPQIQQFYGGYRIGSCTEIYNPWSVLNHIAGNGPFSRWIDTSDNALLEEPFAESGEALDADIEQLLQGKEIRKTIQQENPFVDFGKDSKTPWSSLLFSGYLTAGAISAHGAEHCLRIPNLEIASLYRSIALKRKKSQTTHQFE